MSIVTQGNVHLSGVATEFILSFSEVVATQSLVLCVVFFCRPLFVLMSLI